MQQYIINFLHSKLVSHIIRLLQKKCFLNPSCKLTQINLI